MPQSFAQTTPIFGCIISLFGLVGCDSDSDEYACGRDLSVEQSMGALSGPAKIARSHDDECGVAFIDSPKFRSYEPNPKYTGNQQKDRALQKSRKAQQRSPETYKRDSRFLTTYPNTKLADFARYRRVYIRNPQFFEWSILENARIEMIGLTPSHQCLKEARLEDGGCAYDYEASFVEPNDLLKLTSVVGLRGPNLDVTQPIDDAFFDALNTVLDTFPAMETVTLPAGVDRCLIRWPRSISYLRWFNLDTMKIPDRASRLEYRPYTDKNGNQFDRLAFINSGKFIELDFWRDENMIAVFGAYQNPTRTGRGSSPAYLRATGAGFAEALRLNCGPDAPALHHFGKTAQ